MAYSTAFSTTSGVLYVANGSTNIALDGSQFDVSNYGSNVLGDRPLSISWFKDTNNNTCSRLAIYDPVNRSTVYLTRSNYLTDTWLSNFEQSFGIDLPAHDGSSEYLCFPIDINPSPNVNYVHMDQAYWGSLPATYVSPSYFITWTSYIPSESGGGESGGESGDYSGIISAITLIPATIIMVCLFKMISNIFLNRKVRG